MTRCAPRVSCAIQLAVPLIPCPSPARVAALAADPAHWKSPDDAADLAGIHRETLYRWLASGLYVVDRPGPGPRGRLVVLVDERGFPVKDPEAKPATKEQTAPPVKPKKSRGKRRKGKRRPG